MPDEPPIYVGYLPIPSRHRRLLAMLLPTLLLLAVGAGAVIATAQRNPGPAVWHDDPTIHAGVLIAEPYPVLYPAEGPPIILVAEGKHGLAGIETLAGRTVEVRGTLLERGSAMMLETRGIPAAIESTRPMPEHVPPADRTGPLTLIGEVVDSKCCFGAMKPGDGKTHRACATLCIRGGIPPVLVGLDPRGQPRYTLLAGADGGPANQRLLPLVGERVRASGTLVTRGPIATLHISSVQIDR